MEEVNAYIESGILELYVLVQLTVQEQQEVEEMAARYPEVKQEIAAIELAMEQYALQNSIEPSAELKDQIMNRLSDNETIVPVTAEVEQVIKPTPVVPIQQYNEYEAKIRILRFALAACVAMLVVSAIALYSAHNELGQAKTEILALNLDKQKFASTTSYLTEENTDLRKIADMADDPDWKVVKLAGTKMDPAAKMVVYWHTSGQHVMVDNSKMALPANDQSHQYQLWALVNGKPVDLGVFDVKSDTTQILLAMKEIAGAQAFAVTLEKRGGSVSPTMDQMIVMGGV
ncbi:anti-sigma factor [Pedobacter sp. MC2016-24]|uniref:anti-sigma factor n=1 Tax=Pedobacter sp. MC2016-24 TaxID=2780090 RepID=UPI00188207B1|nr:anti-sigma factor [Pedobacter sp. MC2016-24]